MVKFIKYFREQKQIHLQSLQPFFSPEVPQYGCRKHYHQHNGEGISVGPIELGQYAEVHAVDTGNERWRQEYYRHHGKYLDDFILLQVYKTEECILQVVQTVETEAGIFEQGIDILDNHTQTWKQFSWKNIAFKHT